MELIISKKEKQRIFLTLSIFFIAASLFDAGLTYYHFIEEGKARFVNLEINPIINWGLENNIPFWLNPSIIVNFAMIPVFWWVTKKNSGFFYIFIYLLPIASVLHIYGGITWLIYG